MSDEAAMNGWDGFNSIGERVPGGYSYRCDGMPSPMGCPAEVVVKRRLAQIGTKASGWLVTYGRCDDGDPGDDGKGNDLDIVLTFCPVCAEVVRSQERAA